MYGNEKINKMLAKLIVIFSVIASICMVPVLDAQAQNGQNVVQVTQSYEQGLVQTTKYGKVQGVKEGDVLIWKGISYAKAPVGELRWKAPQDPEKWDGILDARASKVAVQPSAKGTLGTEDALNLDLYRPDSDEKNLPVLMYIHGGNNQIGSSADIAPQKLAVNANCIVISINHRLGLLGFNNLPALKTGNRLEDSGNYAVLDMGKSLDWMKENVTAFGGNPNNITVSGFSAGGRDVMAMLISPILKDKFQKAIAFSGGMTLADSTDSTKVIAKTMAKLVVEDKVKETEAEAFAWLQQNTKEVREYLYNLPAERIAALIGNAGIRMSAFPHLYNDGVVLPKEGFKTKKYNNVPVIMATGSTEFSAFAVTDPYFEATVKNRNLFLTDPKIHDEALFAIKYGSKLYGLFNAEESAVKMLGAYHAPIFTCDIQWGTDEKIVGKEMAELCGAHHGIFMSLLTDAAVGSFSRKFYPDAYNNKGVQDLTAKFQKYIANFLWKGNPNGDDLVKWEAWTNAQKGPSQLLLNADIDKAFVKMSYDRTSYAAVLKEIEADQTIPSEAKNKLIKEVLNGRWFSGQLDEYFGNPSLWVK